MKMLSVRLFLVSVCIVLCCESGAGRTTHQFVEAVKRGDIEKVKKLLRYGVGIKKASLPLKKTYLGDDVSSDVCSKEPILFFTMRKNKFALFDLLLDGVDVNEEIAGGFTPVLFAIFLNQPVMLYHLLMCKADPDKTTSLGAPTLYAAALGYFDMVKMLLDFGADPMQTGKSGETILHWAAYSNAFNVVQQLAACVPLDVKDHAGRKPIDLVKKPGLRAYLTVASLFNGNVTNQKIYALLAKNKADELKNAFFNKVYASVKKKSANRKHGGRNKKGFFTASSSVANKPAHGWKGVVPVFKKTPLSA